MGGKDDGRCAATCTSSLKTSSLDKNKCPWNYRSYSLPNSNTMLDKKEEREKDKVEGMLQWGDTLMAVNNGGSPPTVKVEPTAVTGTASTRHKRSATWWYTPEELHVPAPWQRNTWYYWVLAQAHVQMPDTPCLACFPQSLYRRRITSGQGTSQRGWDQLHNYSCTSGSGNRQAEFNKTVWNPCNGEQCNPKTFMK